ncbi:unnamed protein product [Urochloa humidicola]
MTKHLSCVIQEFGASRVAIDGHVEITQKSKEMQQLHDED